MKVVKDFSLKELNTFGIKASASYYTEIFTVGDFQELIKNPAYRELEKIILGGGSNILLTRDFPGLVIKNNIKGIEVISEDDSYVMLKAGSGEVWHDLVMYTIEKNYAGLENLSLIPGTVGAAPIQNIGAYGVEIKEVFESLEAINLETGEIKSFNHHDCRFGYRDSIFKHELKGKYFIASVTFRLSKNPVFNISYGAIKDTLEEMGCRELSIKSISEAVIHIRRSKLPDPKEIGNAGSFFKNPEITESHFLLLKEKFPDIVGYNTTPGMVKVPAGWLIEKSGLKGHTEGNTGIHKKQALVLVNYGDARGEEIKNLAYKVLAVVKENFDIELTPEVNII